MTLVARATDRGEDDDVAVDGADRRLAKFDWIDIDHGGGRWAEAQILDVCNSSILVRCKGMTRSADEWLDSRSRRIDLLHSHTQRPKQVSGICPADFACGRSLLVLDGRNQWSRALIVKIDTAFGRVLIHYAGLHSRYDEWINLNSYRLAPADSSPVKLIETIKEISSSKNECPPNKNREQYRATESNEANFRLLLQSQLSCGVVEMAYDGNCLFRAVSHQVYGNAELFDRVRQYCCDYMEIESNFFSCYVTDMRFENYLQKMRTDGEWGDHLEIQAMSEIYQRPVLVYAYSTEPMRTYSDASSSQFPIRLSYHLQCHYNSIIGLAGPVLIGAKPIGVVEQEALVRARTNPVQRGDLVDLNDRIDSSEFEHAVNESLTALMENECKSHSLLEMDAGNDLQDALSSSLKSLQDTEDNLMRHALEETMLESIQSLPPPIRHCHVELQFPLDLCVQAYSRIQMDPSIDETFVIQEMIDWILTNSFS